MNPATHGAASPSGPGSPSGPAITGSWERLIAEVPSPGPIGDLAPAGAPAEWWLPALAFLAYHATPDDAARATLDEFARRRHELAYAVVEEQTDQLVGLSVQPWPLVDERGRLRFPIDRDPLQLDVDAADLAAFLVEHRRRWHQLGLLPEPLVERPPALGDTYAVAVAREPVGPAVEMRSPAAGEAPYLCGLRDTADPDRLAVPALDITWDAREAGKLAHYAAAAGVLPTDPDDPHAPVVRETNRRYLVAFAANIDPRDAPGGPGEPVEPGGPGGPEAGP